MGVPLAMALARRQLLGLWAARGSSMAYSTARSPQARARSRPSDQRGRGAASRGGGRRAGRAAAAEEPRQRRPPSAGVLVVDKPEGPTSYQIIGAVRRAFGVKKVGHSGTLDPFASGVLVVCIGRPATRLIPWLQREGDKEYEAEGPPH